MAKASTHAHHAHTRTRRHTHARKNSRCKRTKIIMNECRTQITLAAFPLRPKEVDSRTHTLHALRAQNVNDAARDDYYQWEAVECSEPNTSCQGTLANAIGRNHIFFHNPLHAVHLFFVHFSVQKIDDDWPVNQNSKLNYAPWFLYEICIRAAAGPCITFPLAMMVNEIWKSLCVRARRWRGASTLCDERQCCHNPVVSLRFVVAAIQIEILSHFTGWGRHVTDSLGEAISNVHFMGTNADWFLTFYAHLTHDEPMDQCKWWMMNGENDSAFRYINLFYVNVCPGCPASCVMWLMEGSFIHSIQFLAQFRFWCATPRKKTNARSITGEKLT